MAWWYQPSDDANKKSSQMMRKLSKRRECIVPILTHIIFDRSWCYSNFSCDPSRFVRVGQLNIPRSWRLIANHRYRGSECANERKAHPSDWPWFRRMFARVDDINSSVAIWDALGSLPATWWEQKWRRRIRVWDWLSRVGSKTYTVDISYT